MSIEVSLAPQITKALEKLCETPEQTILRLEAEKEQLSKELAEERNLRYNFERRNSELETKIAEFCFVDKILRFAEPACWQRAAYHLFSIHIFAKFVNPFVRAA